MNKKTKARRNIFANYSKNDAPIVSIILAKALSEKEFSYYLCLSENSDSKDSQLTHSLIFSMCSSQIYLMFISEHSAQSDWLKMNMEVIKEERKKSNSTPKIFLIYLDNSILPDSIMEFIRLTDYQEISSNPEIITQRIGNEFLDEDE